MTGMLLRSAHNTDLAAILTLAEESGIGMTTLPKDIHLLKKRLAWSTQSFQSQRHHPDNDYYLFVLEDTETQRVVGTSAILASIGQKPPFYSYELSTQTRTCPSLGLSNTYTILRLVTAHTGQSELCTLFLDPAYRHKTNGLLLSRSRFLFMADFPERFEPTLVAEMRGVSDEQGHSPFWDAVGHHFIPLPFMEADRLTLATNKQFIRDLMPIDPIYVNLLPKDAQDVIGEAHPSTQAALNILRHEGFVMTKHIDIFDAGPTITAVRNTVKSIRHSRYLKITSIHDMINDTLFIISNASLNFRATVSELSIKEATCSISKKTAHVLQLTVGDYVRCIEFGISFDY
jgi:arginine N-succinyltransferase